MTGGVDFNEMIRAASIKQVEEADRRRQAEELAARERAQQAQQTRRQAEENRRERTITMQFARLAVQELRNRSVPCDTQISYSILRRGLINDRFDTIPVADGWGLSHTEITFKGVEHSPDTTRSEGYLVDITGNILYYSSWMDSVQDGVRHIGIHTPDTFRYSGHVGTYQAIDSEAGTVSGETTQPLEESLRAGIANMLAAKGITSLPG